MRLNLIWKRRNWSLSNQMKSTNLLFQLPQFPPKHCLMLCFQSSLYRVYITQISKQQKHSTPHTTYVHIIVEEIYTTVSVYCCFITSSRESVDTLYGDHPDTSHTSAQYSFWIHPSMYVQVYSQTLTSNCHCSWAHPPLAQCLIDLQYAALSVHTSRKLHICFIKLSSSFPSSVKHLGLSQMV